MPEYSQPRPRVVSLLWHRLLTGYERPASISTVQWWRWTTGAHAPPLKSLASIIKDIGIPESVAIEALGWSHIPRKRKPWHTWQDDRDPLPPLTIKDVVTWANLVRRQDSYIRQQARIKEKLLRLSKHERDALVSKKREEETEKRADRRERLASAEDLSRIGITMPRLRNGHIDYTKLRMKKPGPFMRPDLNDEDRYPTYDAP